jgi:hypothetical protein
MATQSKHKVSPFIFARISRTAYAFMVAYMAKNKIVTKKRFFLHCLEKIGYTISEEDVNLK